MSNVSRSEIHQVTHALQTAWERSTILNDIIVDTRGTGYPSPQFEEMMRNAIVTMHRIEVELDA